MAALPENYIDLTKKMAFAQLATLMPESWTPSLSPLRLIMSGGTKMSCGVGALPRSGLRKKP